MITKTFLLCGVATAALTLTACAPKPLELSENHIKPEVQAPNAAIPEPVYNLPPIKAPKVPVSEEVYTVVVNDVDLRELLFALARDAKINIDIASDIEGSVTLNAIDQSLPQILDRITDQSDIRYKTENGILVIRKDAPYFVHYDISYVNLGRTSTSDISISTQVATTGASATGDSGGVSGGNNSSTAIRTESSNQFWQTLVQNVDALLKGGDSTQAVLGDDSATAGVGDSATATSETETITSANQVSIIANPESGVLSIKASQKQHQLVQRFIDEVLNGAQRQVLIEATIVEVNLNDDFQSGVDWQRLVQNGANGISISQTLTGTNLASPPVFSLDYVNNSSKYDLNATLKLLNEFGNTKVLSTPKLMVLNNQTALIKVVDNRVYFTVDVEEDIEDGLVNRTFTTEVHTVPVGLVMGVTPQISPAKEVTLNIRPTISRILQFVEDPNPALQGGNVKNLIPEISVREMESIMKINDGNIAIIGGLMQDNHKDSTAGLPGFAKLPFAGDLFSYRNNAYNKSELVIFIRPIVISEASVESDLKQYRHLLPSSAKPAAIPSTASTGE